MTTNSLKCIKVTDKLKGEKLYAWRWLRPLACIGLMAIGLPSAARVLVICVPENPIPPFVYSDRESEVQALVREAVELQGDRAQFVRAPWVRCRMGLKRGTYMAALPMVANRNDLQDFSFPQKRGLADERLSIGSLAIGVVARTGSGVDWDGHAFSGLTSPVLVLPGQYVARDKLLEMNVAQDARAVHATSLLHMLIAGRRDAAVLPMTVLEQAMTSKEFPSGLKLFPQPLTKTPVFLGFNKAFEQSHPGYAQSIWEGYAQLSTPYWRPKPYAKVKSCQSARWGGTRTEVQ